MPTTGAVFFMVVGGIMAAAGTSLALNIRQITTKFLKAVVEIRQTAGPDRLPEPSVGFIRVVAFVGSLLGLGVFVIGAVHL